MDIMKRLELEGEDLFLYINVIEFENSNYFGSFAPLNKIDNREQESQNIPATNVKIKISNHTIQPLSIYFLRLWGR
jgi:hypothetical protein